MRKLVLVLAVVGVLAACGGGSSPQPLYDEQGFDADGCNRGEVFVGGSCELAGECGVATEALDAYLVEHGPADSPELSRLETERERVC